MRQPGAVFLALAVLGALAQEGPSQDPVPERSRWLLKFGNRSAEIDCRLAGNSSLCRDLVHRAQQREEERRPQAPPQRAQPKQLDGPESGAELWLEGFPLPPLALAKSRALRDGSSCKRQLGRFLADLKLGRMWAAQMFDASAKFPYGILDGHTRHFGNFDECYRLDFALPGEPERLRGRYCLVDFNYQQLDAQHQQDYAGSLDYDFEPTGSVWESIRERGDFRREKRYILQMALCVPASCSREEIVEGLQTPYRDYGDQKNVRVNVSIDKYNCQAYHEERPMKTSTFVYCGVLVTLALLVIVSTLYDGILQTEEDKANVSRAAEFLLCFSAKRNLKTIFSVNYNHRGLDTIHLIRFFFMVLVLIGHRMMQYYINPVVNKRYLELTFDTPSFIMVLNGTIIVDGFFAIGGLLTCYGLLHQFEKTKKMNFLGLTWIRFFRLTPAYALVIFFHVCLFPYLGSGPQWNSRINAESDYCSNTWWSNLFYLNNYLSMDTICMFQSWYLAVDFHCYLMGIALIYLFWKLPRKLGYSLLAILGVISIVIPYYVTYSQRIQPVFMGFPYLWNLGMDEYFKKYYVVTHMRTTAYMVGVISGAILYDYNGSKWRISKPVSQALFIILVVVTMISSQSLGFKYYNPNTRASPEEIALYASLHRGAFALAACSIVLLITMGDGLSGHYNFFTPPWVQPLGRLTYSVFLSHNLMQQYQIAVTRAARSFSIHTSIWDLVPDIVFTFTLALIISITIEGPFRRIEKHFILKRAERLPPKSSEETKVERKKID